MALGISDRVFTVKQGAAAHEITLTLTASTVGEITGKLIITSNATGSPTEIDISAKSSLLVGDVSGDGTVSAYDAALILKFVVGLIDKFPIEYLMGNSPSNALEHDYEVSIPSFGVTQGQRIAVPIFINDVPEYLAGGISLKYDSTVLKPVSAYTKLSEVYWQSNINLAGEVRVGFASVPTNTESAQSKDETLFVVEFDVLADAEGKVSELILEQVQLSDSLSIKKTDGLITVLPTESRLYQNYPNPFNPETWIPFKLAQNTPVTINIYNTKGQLIRTISLGKKNAGVYTSRDKAVYWDGRSSEGSKVASGLYFYTLQAENFTATRKMVILK